MTAAEPITRPLAPGLESLVWPVSPAAFLRDHWQRRPLHVRGTPDRLPALAELFCGFDLGRILAAADLRRTLVQPPLTEQRRRSPRDLLPEAVPEANTLLLLYELGSQLYVATSGLPGMEDWIEPLSQELGRIWSAGRGDLYATRAGGGADTHFDQNDNFTVQLTGRKVWFYGTEPHYREPLHNSGELQGIPYDPTFAFDPREVDPAGLQEVELGPGDVFYLPRGVLHGTRADEDSLSFNLSFGPQPWADLLLEGLRAWLIRDPGLRQGATGDPVTAEARLARFQQLVAGLRAEDLVGGGTRGDRMRRNPLAWWSCADPSAEPCITVDFHAPDRRTTRFELSPEVLELLQALPDGPEPFVPDDLLLAWGEDLAAGRELLDALIDVGLLGRV